MTVCTDCGQKLDEDFAKFLWPSQNIWTLPFHHSHKVFFGDWFSWNKPIHLFMTWISSQSLILILFFYRQICDSTPPLHPVLPALLEVFVNSALVPASNRGSPDQTVNEPISEHEIRAVFQVSSCPAMFCSVFFKNWDQIKNIYGWKSLYVRRGLACK